MRSHGISGINFDAVANFSTISQGVFGGDFRDLMQIFLLKS